ncbi:MULTISPECIES: TetR/AcrR family transcriptional regulator [Nocardioides]|uniref:TetR/AcrR family transcriptional regulator n=1 Tax=Nocardioides vastitatis TaxID=2568655 RepID=A0ABW0ZEU1_9ACTN|nr:TetR/AcrR family transcriptional regulator [Nocardioides sp.]THJ08612.1 TetR/AcrR family transcriptional regulator [Nocardioides sp.]
MPDPIKVTTRTDRRKARTRAALIKAAQRFLAEGRVNVAVLEITQTADIGLGSFYNHFETKEELFRAAIDDALEAHADLLEELTADIDDPAVVFAHSFRLTGRLHRAQPELSRVVLSSGPALLTSNVGLAPRARRDIEAAVRRGRFKVADIDLAMVVVAGAAIALGQLLHARPERDDAAATDQVTQDVLRMLGLTSSQARKICAMPLPQLILVDREQQPG